MLHGSAAGRSQPLASTFIRRTYFGRPSSTMRFSDATAMATSVALPPVGPRPQRVTDHSLVAADIRLHQGTPIVTRPRCEPMRPRSVISCRCRSRFVGAVSAVALGTALATGRSASVIRMRRSRRAPCCNGPVPHAAATPRTPLQQLGERLAKGQYTPGRFFPFRLWSVATPTSGCGPLHRGSPSATRPAHGREAGVVGRHPARDDRIIGGGSAPQERQTSARETEGCLLLRQLVSCLKLMEHARGRVWRGWRQRTWPRPRAWYSRPNFKAQRPNLRL